MGFTSNLAALLTQGYAIGFDQPQHRFDRQTQSAVVVHSACLRDPAGHTRSCFQANSKEAALAGLIQHINHLPITAKTGEGQ